MPPIRPTTPEEEAAIQRGIEADPDNPEWTEDDFAHARPAAEAMPELVRRRGQQAAPTKELISVRLDCDLMKLLHASGPGWHGRINAALRKAVMG